MTVQIIVGDCLRELRKLPAESAHCCVTSPPYYGKRDYGNEPTAWGGDEACEHRWGEELLDRSKRSPGTQGGSLTGDGCYQAKACRFEIRSNFCVDCGAWRGSLGLEIIPDCGRQFMKLRPGLTADQRSFVVRRLRDEGLLDVGLCGMGRKGLNRSTSGTSALGMAPTTSDDERETGLGSRRNLCKPSYPDQGQIYENPGSASTDNPFAGSSCTPLSSSDVETPSSPKPEAEPRSAKGQQRSLRGGRESTPDLEAPQQSSAGDLQGMFDQASLASRDELDRFSRGHQDASLDSLQSSGRSSGTTSNRNEHQSLDKIPGTDRRFDEILLASAIVPADLARLFHDSLCSSCYVCHMVLVFEEVRRVLRRDGTLWLNLGDTYATGAGKVGDRPGGGEQGDRWAGMPLSPREDVYHRGYRGERLANGSKDQAAVLRKKTRATRDGSHAGINIAMAARGPMTQPNRLALPGLKPKDLIGIPWMCAFALRRAGWWLRGENIWAKPNPMPESTTDRCTVAHETVFLLAKSERYFYDAAAVAEEAIYQPGGTHDDVKQGGFADKGIIPMPGQAQRAFRAIRETRNKRSVWTLPTTPFPGAHFATFPPALVEPCVKAGTSEHGACRRCAAPWARVARKIFSPQPDVSADKVARRADEMDETSNWDDVPRGTVATETLGWYPTCKCDALPSLPPYPKKAKGGADDDVMREASERIHREACEVIDDKRSSLCRAASGIPVKRAVVIDPFGGAGTTALVADRLQRDGVIIEMNPGYAEMARKRIDADAGMFGSAAE